MATTPNQNALHTALLCMGRLRTVCVYGVLLTFTIKSETKKERPQFGQ